MSSRRSCRSCAGPSYGVFVGGGGGVVRTGVGVGGDVGGDVTTGADVAGGGVADAALVLGATVVVVMLMLGSGERAADADADGDAEPDVAGANDPRVEKSRKMTTSVASTPATAASARSIHRGPRRGGGEMSLVVSDTGVHAACGMPLIGRAPGALFRFVFVQLARRR